MHEGVAQANWAIKLAGVLVRAPGLFLALIVDDHRGVQHHAGGRKTLVERSRINERLEPRTRLAPGLDDPVVFALKEIKAADQGDDRAVFRATHTSAPCASGICTKSRDSGVRPTV